MVGLPRRTTRQLQTWTSDELRRFLEHTRPRPMYPVVLLAATTGMRRSEVLGLPWRAVDLDARRLPVTQTLVMVGGTPKLTEEAKTAHARRSIALDHDTVEVLRAHRRTQLEERLKAGSVWEDRDLVFTQEDGSPVRPPKLTRWVQHQSAEAGVPQIGMHAIRHTWATLALRLGIHPKVVAERLGHSSIKITLDTYSHAVPEMQERAAQQVADLVFGRSSVEAQ